MPNAINIHIQKDGALGKIEAQVKSALDKGLQMIREKITMPSVDIIVDDNVDETIQETGIGGYAPSASLLHIHINPAHENMQKNLEAEIVSTLAHEMHHCARWATVGYGNTLLEAMVSEGLADHFDNEACGSKTKPWDVALQGESLERVKMMAVAEYSNEEYDHSAWFFGTKEIPRWAGYVLGYLLVGDYIKKTGKKASELVGEKAQNFIET